MLDRLRSWLDDVATAELVEPRHTRLLQQALLACIVLALLSLVITVFGSNPLEQRFRISLAVLAATFGIFVALLLSYRGRIRLSATIASASMLVALALVLLNTGVAHARAGLLAFAIPTILIGLLGNRRSLVMCIAASCAIIVMAAWLEHRQSPLSSTEDHSAATPMAVLTALVMLIFIALIIDRYSVALRETLFALQSANQRLHVELAERRRAEQELREREEFLRSIYEGAEMPIFVVDVDDAGDFRYVGSNPAHQRATGHGGDMIAGRRPEDFLPPEFAAHVRAAYEKAVRDGTPSTEEQVYAPQGVPTYWLRLLTPLRDDSGRVTRLVGTGIDITERRRTLEALRESEERFRLITENISDLIFMVDGAQRFAYASPAFERLLGYDPERLIGTPVLDAVHAEDLAQVRDRWAPGAHQGVAQVTFRYRHALSADWVWFEARSASAVWQGEPVVIVVARDVTQQRRLQAQLIQAQKMEGIGRLAGGVAHDFNNLLVAVDGYAQLAADELPPDHVVQEDLREIRRAADRATKLTRQLLAFARRQISDPQVISLNDLLADMDRMLRRLIREDITLVIAPAPELWPTRADVGQIEQVIVNLVVNARDAMPDGGRLTIETRNVTLDEEFARTHPSVIPGPYVMVAVSDNGVGMDAQTMQHLFEPFFTTKPPGAGTGLGLATCYGIVKQHGGTIWAYSEVGCGSTFMFYLPRAEGEPTQLRRGEEAGELPRGSERILLVEDDQLVRDMAARVLRGQGYTVLVAAHGEEALQMAADPESPPVDLLLTDVVMPRLGGRALAEQLMAHYPGMKVLYTSGYTDTAIVHHGQLEEGLSFLHKPFTPAALIRKVRETLDS